MARSAKDHKTNALRELAAAGLPHEALFFEADPSMTGVEIAHAQGEEVDAVFKTLVTEGKSGTRRPSSSIRSTSPAARWAAKCAWPPTTWDS